MCLEPDTAAAVGGCSPPWLCSAGLAPWCPQLLHSCAGVWLCRYSLRLQQRRTSCEMYKPGRGQHVGGSHLLRASSSSAPGLRPPAHCLPRTPMCPTAWRTGPARLALPERCHGWARGQPADAEAVLLIRRKIAASSVPPSGVLHSIPACMQLLLPQCAKAGGSQFDLCSWRAAAACTQQNPPYIYRRLYC